MNESINQPNSKQFCMIKPNICLRFVSLKYERMKIGTNNTASSYNEKKKSFCAFAYLLMDMHCNISIAI